MRSPEKNKSTFYKMAAAAVTKLQSKDAVPNELLDAYLEDLKHPDIEPASNLGAVTSLFFNTDMNIHELQGSLFNTLRSDDVSEKLSTRLAQDLATELYKAKDQTVGVGLSNTGRKAEANYL